MGQGQLLRPKFGCKWRLSGVLPLEGILSLHGAMSFLKDSFFGGFKWTPKERPPFGGAGQAHVSFLGVDY